MIVLHTYRDTVMFQKNKITDNNYVGGEILSSSLKYIIDRDRELEG